MAAETITLLHLSDPQFGRNHLFGSAGLTKADQHRDSLFARLHEDLRGLEQQQGLRPEVVVVSGDLAETGTRRELEQVFEFLEQLAGTLGLERRRVLVVPGNHDINRKLCEAYFLRCEAEDEEPRAPYWPKWEPFDTMLSRFYAAEPSVGFTIEHPWTLFELPELRLVVAGLNSTMAESHRDGDHYGRVGEEQLAWFAERLAPYETQGWLRVAVVHHNVQRAAVDDDENLRDADDLARVLGPHVNLVLHGHTHNAKLGWLRPEVPVVSTGSAAVKPGARPAEVPNQYQVLRVGPGRLERWGRRYEPDQRRWAGDTRLSDDGNAWRTEDEVRFTAVHGAFPDAVSAAGPMRGRSTADPHVEERRGDAAARERREVLRDDLLARVAVVCQLRRRDATVTEFRDHDPPYLRVSVSHEGVARVHPVGVCQRGIDRAAVDAFISGVHVNYRAVDPLVCSELVYGGDPAPQALVGDAWQRGVRLLSFLEYQGILDLRGYVARQTRRLDADPVYPPALYVPQRFTRLDGLGGDDRPGGDDLLAQVVQELAVPQGGSCCCWGTSAVARRSCCTSWPAACPSGSRTWSRCWWSCARWRRHAGWTSWSPSTWRRPGSRRSTFVRSATCSARAAWRCCSTASTSWPSG